MVSRNKAKALAKAQQHLQRNNIDRALRELVGVVKDDPKDLRTRQKIAELLARQGRHPEAMKEFTVVAETYAHGGFFPKAVSIYKQMIRIEPTEMAHHLALGEVYQQLAHLSDAMAHFNVVAAHYEAKGTTKDRITIYQKLSTILPESLEYAEKLANICLEDADPQAAFEVWKQLANCLAPKGTSDALLKAYEGMHKFRADDLELTRKLADLYLDRGQPKKALEKLQEAFKVDSQDTETLNLLADAFVDLGQKDKAVAILKELARIYDSVGFDDYKNQVFDRITELDPEGGAEFQDSGNALVVALHPLLVGLSLGDEEQLDEQAQRAVFEVDVYREYGLSERALSSVEKGIAQFSDCFALHRQLAALSLAAEDLDRAKVGLTSMYEIAMDKGDYRVARDSLIRIVDLDPEDEVAVEKLQAFEDAMGEYVGEPESLEADGGLVELDAVPLEQVDAVPLEQVDAELDDVDVAASSDDDADLVELHADALKAEPLAERSLSAISVVSGSPTDMSIPVMSIGDDALEELDAGLFETLRTEFDQEDSASAALGDAEGGDGIAEELSFGDAGDGDFGDFDFDDEELQRLADEMSGATEIASADDGSSLESEPKPEAEAGASPEAVPEPPVGAAPAAPADPDQVGLGSSFDLSDLMGLDDLDDDMDALPSAFALGKSYFDSGCYKDAVIELQRAVEEGDERPRALELLGVAQRRLRDFKAAVSSFRQLLSLNPADPDLVLRVLYELATTYEVVGKSGSAQSLYRKLLQLSPGYRDGEVAKRLEQLGG